VNTAAGSGWAPASSRLASTASLRPCNPTPTSGRILAAYGGIFVAGSLAWGMALDGFRPDRWDITGALICLAGVAIIMYAPRSA